MNCAECGKRIKGSETERVERAPWTNPSGFNAMWSSPGMTRAVPCGCPWELAVRSEQ